MCIILRYYIYCYIDQFLNKYPGASGIAEKLIKN